MKTTDFRKNRHKEYDDNELEEFKGLRKVKFGKDFHGSFANDEELSKPIDYNHDPNAGEKHRLAVEVLVEILREKRYRVICNPDFALQKCDVLDITTNTRYEIQTANISEKLKKCSENTVVIPIRDINNNRKELYKYIFEFLKYNEVWCV